MSIPVLFVDDEEDIRFSFQAHFEGKFPVYVAANGTEALQMLNREHGIGVVVTDIRMPEMNGLELIRQSRPIHPDLGFIVVSGHGEAEHIIEALRLGARNYLRKPYELVELEEAIHQEARRFDILRQERAEREQEKYVEQFVTAVNGLTYSIPSDLQLVNPIAFLLAQTMHSIGICNESERGNLALALIEMITNAIEHGNLGLTGGEKVRLKTEGEQVYLDDIRRRQNDPAYKDRQVTITATMDREQAVFQIQDEGNGFNYAQLPDPTDPEYLFLPSGRGILLARSIMDELTYIGDGNIVRLVKKKSRVAD